MAKWTNDGPASPGAIITAILNHDDQAVKDILRRWSPADLKLLNLAAHALMTHISVENSRRDTLA